MQVEQEGKYFVSIPELSDVPFEPLHVIARPCIDSPYRGADVEELDGGRPGEPGTSTGAARWPLVLREGTYELEVVVHGMGEAEYDLTIAWEEPLDED